MAVLSFYPDDMVQGTGLLTDVNAKVVDAKFDYFVYPGTNIKSLSAMITVATDDGEKEEIPYSIGDSKGKFQVAEGGKSLTSVSGEPGLPKGSNFAFFTTALKEIGVPKEMIQAGDISLFKGLYAFWQRRPTPERSSLTKTPAQIEKEKKYGPPSALIPVKLLALPGEKSGKGKASSSTAPSGGSAEDAIAAATEYVLGVLNDKGGRATRKSVGTLAFSKLAKNPMKNAIIALLGSDEFIENLAEVGIAVDDDSLVLVG